MILSYVILKFFKTISTCPWYYFMCLSQKCFVFALQNSNSICRLKKFQLLKRISIDMNTCNLCCDLPADTTLLPCGHEWVDINRCRKHWASRSARLWLMCCKLGNELCLIFGLCFRCFLLCCLCFATSYLLNYTAGGTRSFRNFISLVLQYQTNFERSHL